MIEKLPLEKPKAPSRRKDLKGYRMFGIGLTPAEEAIAVKVNEIIDELNESNS